MLQNCYCVCDHFLFIGKERVNFAAEVLTESYFLFSLDLKITLKKSTLNI